jgi:predicted MPP superfamily phosphohydrolase
MKTPGLRISRRRFLGGVSFATIGSLGYARLFEAEWLQRSFVTVPLGGREVVNPVKLLHLSDLHASPVVSLRYLRRAIDAAVAWKPDLICVTGDFITRTFDDMAGYVRVLERLSGTAPTFASLGNHDGGRWAGDQGGHRNAGWVGELLQHSGVGLLHNDSIQIRIGERILNLVGVGDMWAGDMDIPGAFGPRRSGETIVLSHNPDTKEHLGAFNWQLMLCGHTHGGQLRVPWVGATPFAPVRDKRFVAGLGRWNERWIHVTRGVGSVYGMRINCPPELSFLTLT